MIDLNSENTLEALLLGLPSIKGFHPTSNDTYKVLKKIAKEEVAKLFSDESKKSKAFGPFGEIAFPFFKMGNINSLDLFGMDELIIFSFYWANRNRYKNVLDIGGNIGLHSIIMSKCGYSVKTFEPDDVHFEKLKENLQLNHCSNVEPIQAAVSTKKGTTQFVRVLGNTTSSHIQGGKTPYGKLEEFVVKVEDIKEILKNSSVDLIKMDVEGHEKEIIQATNHDDWLTLDAMIEVGSDENAEAIFDHLKVIDVNAFAQKKGWKKISSLDDVPTSYRDGSLFISLKPEMPWEQT